MVAAIAERDRERIRAQGLVSLEPMIALTALQAALTSGAAECLIAEIDWPAFQRAAHGGVLPPLCADFASRAPESAPRAWMRAELEAAAPSARKLLLLKQVRAEVRKVLGKSAELGDRQGLSDAGLDSLGAIDLKNRLATGLGTALPSTLVFDHPSVAALAEYLTTALSVLFAEPPPPASASELDRLSEDELALLLAEELAGAAPPREKRL